MNELENTQSLGATDLFLNNSAAGRIEAIRTEALELVFDITTAKGRDECISHAAKVTKTKTSIEKLGKALVDPIKAQSKEIDKERKLYRDELEAIKAEVRKPVTLWEDEQAAIKAKIDQHVFELEQAGVSTSPVTGELLSESALLKKIKHIEGINLSDFGDRSEAAELVARAGLTRIRAALQQRKDADELAELRKAKEVREAEEARVANEKRIADAAIAKHEAAKIDNAPKATVEDLKSELESPQTDADKRRSVNLKILNELTSRYGMPDAQARLLISAIVNNKIANISINY